MSTTETSRVATFRKSGTNLVRAKAHNWSVVLELVRTQGPISRTDISKVTALSRQTIQNIVGGLQDANLVRMEAGEAKGRGHPGMMVSIIPDSAFTIGFHVEKVSLRAVVCDLEGNELWSTSQLLEGHRAANANQAILSVLEEFGRCFPKQRKSLLGLGIAAPGPFGNHSDERDEMVTFREMGSADNLALLEELAGLPISLENDASAAAVGEMLYGAGAGFNTFAFMQFGMGLGAGFVLDGSPYYGASCNAGEIGHIVVEPDGKVCSCGKRGCLERYLSVAALYEALDLTPEEQGSLQELVRLVEERGDVAKAWLDKAGQRFRQAVDILEVLIDPEVIIVGGSAPQPILEALLEHSQPFFPSFNAERESQDRVILGTAGPNTVALGAAAVAMNDHFAPNASRILL